MAAHPRGPGSESGKPLSPRWSETMCLSPPRSLQQPCPGWSCLTEGVGAQRRGLGKPGSWCLARGSHVLGEACWRCGSHSALQLSGPRRLGWPGFPELTLRQGRYAGPRSDIDTSALSPRSQLSQNSVLTGRCEAGVGVGSAASSSRPLRVLTPVAHSSSSDPQLTPVTCLTPVLSLGLLAECQVLLSRPVLAALVVAGQGL